MKALIMNVSPQEALNILNGNQIALLRKQIPKGFVGWCYLWVSKAKPTVYWRYKVRLGNKDYDALGGSINSTIPARFWFDECKQIKSEVIFNKCSELVYSYNVFYNDLCLDHKKFEKCIGNEINSIDNISYYNAYAIHIKQLEIFDKPKELNQFKKYISKTIYCGTDCPPYQDEVLVTVANAPKNWQYVYLEGDSDG